MPGSIFQKNSPINPATWHPYSCLTSPGLCLPSHLPAGKHHIILEVQEFTSGKHMQTPSKGTEGHIFYPNVVRGFSVSVWAKVPDWPLGSSVSCQTAEPTPSLEAHHHPKTLWQIQGQEKPVPLLSISCCGLLTEARAGDDIWRVSSVGDKLETAGFVRGSDVRSKGLRGKGERSPSS